VNFILPGVNVYTIYAGCECIASFLPGWNALFEYQRPPESEVPDWYLEKVNKLLTLPEKYLVGMFGGDEETARKVSRILWGGVHGICSLGRTHRLGGDGAEVLKAMAYSLIENYLKGITKDIEI